jgi:putative SOS response-associated peptidase YedK
MHKPGEEKRMPVLIAEADYQGWLNTTAQAASGWMRAWPAVELQGRAAPRDAARVQPARTTGPASGQNLSLF